jgi:glutaredoxin
MRHLILLLALYGGYQAWEHFSRAPQESNAPLHAEPYLAVYGRDACGYTQATRRQLERAGIRYQYHSVDNPAVADLLHRRMQNAGLEVRRYTLPVVDLNNAIAVHPDNDELVAQARELAL